MTAETLAKSGTSRKAIGNPIFVVLVVPVPQLLMQDTTP
jgi:hypothetical protein